MSIMLPPPIVLVGSPFNGEDSLSEWIYSCFCKCLRCGKDVGQTVRLPKVGEFETDRPSNESIENALKECATKNHKCALEDVMKMPSGGRA